MSAYLPTCFESNIEVTPMSLANQAYFDRQTRIVKWVH